MQKLYLIFFPAPLLCSPSSSKENDSMAAQSIVTNLPHAYTPPCVPIKKKKKKERKKVKRNTEGLVSSLTSVLTAALGLTSSPGGHGGATECPESMVTCLYLGNDPCFTSFFFIQSNKIIVVWQCTLSLMYTVYLVAGILKVYQLSTQTWFKRIF